MISFTGTSMVIGLNTYLGSKQKLLLKSHPKVKPEVRD
jgi:hypothetical protein